ncbi:hypothetical protein [Paenibacillus sp. JJ-223]|uniref:hypothetical protein n=1 Tax=Paenibacillus sp. JJ-223 TaxID=2905647 RepID=UPI001F226189|nr:hypothetical protein [Paenibacillus sp. JJ-223]CAH1214466.1 hypothetical protein PAECIP111890_04096 [Paenibacillus sp. JJ-223]
MDMMTILAFAGIFVMFGFYALAGYYLIPFISKKAFKRQLDAYQILLIILFGVIIVQVVQVLMYGEWRNLVTSTGVLFPLMSLILALRMRKRNGVPKG